MRDTVEGAGWRAARALAIGAAAGGGAVLSCAVECMAQSPFASRVMAFDPAPGQNVNNTAFNDPALALGPPIGGGVAAADSSKVVTLGGFGGSITLGFDHPIVNQPASPTNLHGLDFIVFGNAFWVGGNPNRRFMEAAVVEVSSDTNQNGLADDPWYVIRGSHLSAVPAADLRTQGYDDDVFDLAFPPLIESWIPAGRVGGGGWSVSSFRLPSTLNGPVVVNPAGPFAEGVYGYADSSPTILLGDLDADGVIDDAAMLAEAFYTRPDDPMLVGVTPGSGGGDAMAIEWAVNGDDGTPANLSSIDFVRVTTGASNVHPLFGENSTEIGGIAEVFALPGIDFNGDGVISPDDLDEFITAYFDKLARADFDGNGVLSPDDLDEFITAYFNLNS